MPSFSSPVNAPSTRDYAPPAVDFSILGNLYNSYQQSGLNDQAKQANALALQQQQQQIARQKEIQAALANIKPGDYPAIAATLAKFGDFGDLSHVTPLIQQQKAGEVPGILSGGIEPQGSAPAPAGDLPPTAGQGVAARPLPPAQGGGDSGSGSTIIDIATDQYGPEAAGRIANRVTATMGYGPNAELPTGQRMRAQVLAKRAAAELGIAPQNAPTGPSASPRLAINDIGGVVSDDAAPAPMTPNTRVASAFAAQGMGPPVPASPSPPVAPNRASPAQPAPAVDQPSPAAAGAAGAQPGSGFHLEPLPAGYTDPDKAIAALRLAASRSKNPQAVAQIDDKIKAIQKTWFEPEKVGAGQILIDRRTGTAISPGGQRTTLTPQALSGAGMLYFETGKFPPNISRGVQGTAERDAIQNWAYDYAQQRGIDPGDLPKQWQQFATRATGLRTFEQRAAGLTLAENEAKTLIPRVSDLIDKVSRTKYPTINSLIVAGEKGTGDPDEVRLGIAAKSLVGVYARIIKPVGQITEGDTNRAADILNVAWAKGQMRAALDQMNIELQATKKGLQAAREEYSGGGGAEESATTAPSKSSSGGNVVKWERGPDGLPRPAQ
jgi:hypothetical protein